MTKIKSIDVMKLTKDVLNSPPPASEVSQIPVLFKSAYPALTHIAISVPINENSEFKTHGVNTDVAAYEKLWVDEIHKIGLNVIFRGTFCDWERDSSDKSKGLYGFPGNWGDESYWFPRIDVYINRLKGILKSRDVVAILPESTEHVFDGFSPLANNGQSTYNQFFKDLINKLRAELNPLGVEVLITNNYSEIINGYAGDVPVAEGVVTVDHYGGGDTGAQTVANMKSNLESLHSKYNLPVFLQEWADTGQQGNQHTTDMAAMFTAEFASGVMTGVNFWCGFDAPDVGILSKVNGKWTLNSKASALKDFFSGTAPTPSPIPPTPTPTTQQVVSFTLINADTNSDIRDLVNNETLELSTLPTKNLNIRVNTNPTTVGSVKVEGENPHTENGAPYSVYGDDDGPPPVYIKHNFVDGTFTVTATPYDQPNLAGNVGTPMTLTFSVKNTVTPTPPPPTPTPPPASEQIWIDPNPVSNTGITWHSLKVNGVEIGKILVIK